MKAENVPEGLVNLPCPEYDPTAPITGPVLSERRIAIVSTNLDRSGFVRDHNVVLPLHSPSKDLGLGECLKFAAEDLKAFYNEAATSQPGEATSMEIENWYWGDSRAGKLVREVRLSCAVHADNMVKGIGFGALVPVTQVYRDR